MYVFEILFVCLCLVTSAAIGLILCNCIVTCTRALRPRRKLSVEELIDDYEYNKSIEKLRERYGKAMNGEDVSVTVRHVKEVSSVPDTPVIMRSRSNSERLKKLKEDLDGHRLETPISSTPTSPRMTDNRRTWSVLNESMYEPIELPTKIDEGCQTTATLERGRKIETVV